MRDGRALLLGILVLGTGCDEVTVCAGDGFLWGGVCVSSSTCPAPYDVCVDPDGAAVCIDPAADPIHCGFCGNTCFADEVCAFGACQPAGFSCGDYGLATCFDGCVDVLYDAFNCGDCGLVCEYGSYCAGGVCQLDYSCEAAGLATCGFDCVDLFADPYNCGGCGFLCPTALCVDGACL